ncbi:MAG: M20/M25/M40 family metallo-hydrolase [Verrucomicrobia bacterium]|nr:M20/M25/M40 family metallo-hydrolase [Verrucomicrobiota bacterium]
MISSQTLLRELIAIPSVNPAFLPLKDPRGGEKNMADFVLALGASNGLDAELRKVLPNRSNVLLRYRPTGRIVDTVVLAPHLDTVGEPSMPDSMFRPITKNGRLHGRGACDTKGSVSAMLTALLNVAGSPNRPKQTEIVFAGLIDEENSQEGSRALAGSKFKASLAVVGEPTRLKVVTAHKGDLWIRLDTVGKSAHGSRPELGRNAVHAMAQIVDLLETRYAESLRTRKHPLLGSPTGNVGSISGGTQPNIVPGSCWISVDRRTIPGETEKKVYAEIKALLRQYGRSARLSNIRTAFCDPLETDPNHPLVRSFFRAAGQKHPEGVDFFCDAAVLACAGIPSVVFGPGDIAQAHTADEWISLESLDKGTALLTRFLQSLP